MTGWLADLVIPLRRHWVLPVSLGLAFGWWVAAVNLNPLLASLHGGAAVSLVALYTLAASIGLPVGGVLWTRRPAWARPATAGALVAAAVLTGLLPLAPAAAWGGMHAAMGFLTGLWYPVWGAELAWKVPPTERGRVVGWAIALAYAPGQVSIWMQPWVSPTLMALGHAALVAAAAAVPLRADAPEGAPARRGALRPWRRLLLFALVAGPLVGVVRAVDAPILVSAAGVGRHAELLLQGAGCLFAGVIIDRRGRVPAVVAGVLVLGVALSVRLVSAAAAGQALAHAGARVGVPMLEVFWAAILADLSRAFGPAATFGFGHGIALLTVGVGLWAGQMLPAALIGGAAILAAFAATGLLWGLPETGLGLSAPRPGGPDLAAALTATARRPLTRREQEVALLLLEGLSTGEIAAALFVTEYTVRAHLHHIYGKTGTGSRQELLARVLQLVAADRGA